ncbi:MAG: Molybdopterin-guanine dinucleotide biosynthesis protein MobB [Candidatus Tokpelaia hoelldobleri]|uniref:Molybdopterin-guanine dinucleotide biosynthesis protein MobB n=1 Tax=Candidatus Tokpelaia hoelldobleri TaxID=1902579 RepID=A0A1U9JV86_9HYPH|nr:MAG: Molybdopterin-guanine dinucleotide biosynthesis protein MobB [Candidatus Tokpelaia hoelldoblerii]
MKQRVFGITGWKNSGKTTMTTRLVAELTRRGYRLATVKHAHHDFDIDHENTDSWRHRKAGAGEVAVVSSRRWALIHELAEAAEPDLGDILQKFGPCDLVLVEGYKREGHDKLEVRREQSGKGGRLSAADPHIVAIASDRSEDEGSLPVFHLDDSGAIADFIEKHMGLEDKKR